VPRARRQPFGRIREIHRLNRKLYGTPRIHAELALADGVRVARKRVERLMREAGISDMVARRRGRTTIRVPGVRVCEDLVDRAFLAAAPNRPGSPTSATSEPGRAGCTWSPMRCRWRSRSAARLRVDLALRSGQPARTQPVLATAFCSMNPSAAGEGFDNALAESLVDKIKRELVHGRSWPSKAELRTEVFEYIEVFFNRRRRHSTLGYLSPAEIENRLSRPTVPASPLRGSHPPTRSA
jgi:putative transposase